MTLMEAVSLFRAHEVEILSAAAAVVFVWQSYWQRLSQQQRDAMERAWPRLVGFMRILTALFPAVRDAYLATRHQLVSGQTKTDVVRGSQPPPPPGDDGPPPPAVLSVGAGVLLLLLVCGAAGCPVWEREACGSPRSFACRNDQPFVCSPSGRWTPVGDETCAHGGGVCAVLDGGVAACVPADGGAP